MLGRQTFESLPQTLELPATPTDCVSRLDSTMIRMLAGWYVNRLNDLAGQRAERVVDKLPENYHYLGLLVALFPKATVIHCRRDLRDVALSCWMKTTFPPSAGPTTHGHIAKSVFHAYLRLMEHWRSVLPATLHEVDYEETVADLEGVARRLVAALGLDWDPACLEFHRTRRAIRTGSLHQVRQPLFQQSVGRWRHYEHELADLFAALPRPSDLSSDEPPRPTLSVPGRIVGRRPRRKPCQAPPPRNARVSGSEAAMRKPFDATTRQLIELGPAEWLEYLGLPVADPRRVTVIDSNLSTFTADADKVIRVDDPSPWIELVELQAGRDVRLDKRSHGYSTLLELRHQIPVRTSLVLLRPAADEAGADRYARTAVSGR